MFGRAGRIGAGENQGWAFMIVDETQRSNWQARLAAGHTVRSQIESSLPDHILAEAVQGRIHSTADAQEWWAGTLAHHQGSRSFQPLHSAIGFLIEGGYLTATSDDRSGGFVPSELGKVTTRLMVATTVGHEVRLSLRETPVPDTADEAELALINLVATQVPKLAQAAINEDLKTVVSQLLRPNQPADYQAGDLARVALLLAAESPQDFHRGARSIAGVPYMALYPVLEEAPRYLHWIGVQGPLGTVHPWSAIVAADLSRRVKWRRCQPPRGAGRLLWMCEQMATRTHAEELVPQLWTAATARGFTSPDWTAIARPRNCQLSLEDYAQLLRERATSVTIDLHANRTNATAPDGSVLVAWTGNRYGSVTMPRGTATLQDNEADGTQRTAAVFTWRGDYQATGWLGRYSQVDWSGLTRPV
jgi:helicase